MENTVYIRTYAPPPVDRGEIWRYAGVRGDAVLPDALLDECLSELSGKLTFRVVYRELPITRTAEGLDLGFMTTDSRDLAKNLAGCGQIILFAATVGLAPDRAIARATPLSPTKALLADAAGAERIEALCDAFCREIGEEKRALGLSLRPRFSAGYGDFPLAAQKSIFAALSCGKIGLSLNESLVMSPSKSVTAIIGVGK